MTKTQAKAVQAKFSPNGRTNVSSHSEKAPLFHPNRALITNMPLTQLSKIPAIKHESLPLCPANYTQDKLGEERQHLNESFNHDCIMTPIGLIFKKG